MKRTLLALAIFLLTFAACGVATDVGLEIIEDVEIVMAETTPTPRPIPTPTPEPTPPPEPPNTVLEGPITAFAAGNEASFALRPDGTLWGWGNNMGSRIGGSGMTHTTPIMILYDVASFSVLDSFGMAIRTDGSLWAWGNNLFGQLGNGARTPQSEPIWIMDDVAYVSVGRSHTMAIKTDGTLWGWGRNNYGQLGDGTTEDSAVPVRIIDDVTAVSVGHYHTVAIRGDGNLWVWGDNNFGQLGDGTLDGSLLPIMSMEGVAHVSTGSGNPMVITNDGALWGWGVNSTGQLGDGTAGSATNAINMNISHEPVRIMDGVVAVNATVGLTAVIREDGTLWMWGVNTDGQVGNNRADIIHINAIMVASPNPTMIMEDIVAVSPGIGHTMAMTTDGRLWAWGRNNHGQLGDGTQENRHTPVLIME
ncbi:MAG: hypothetical protein FWC76_07830 [Defluviitaleaceae bacterium]|nr:hypothetical protein [Defluviitaleaceae bacterium]